MSAAASPSTPETGFALASISKTFTAAVVLQLVNEGKLKLDERVAPLLPAFGIDKRVTVRMLLDHTSDLNDFFFNPKIDHALQSNPDATWTAKRTWRYVPPGRIRPGKVWSYSNTNYMVLGELVKAVTGRPLAEGGPRPAARPARRSTTRGTRRRRSRAPTSASAIG